MASTISGFMQSEKKEGVEDDRKELCGLSANA